MFEINSIDPVIHRVYDHSRMNDAGFCWRKVFVIDDFYKNPDEVRDYALSCERKNDKENCGGLIGSRVVEENQEMIDNLRPVFTKLCQHDEWKNVEYTDEMFQYKWDNMKFLVNHTTNEDINRRFNKEVFIYTHHKDDIDTKWAALVYLNKPEECDGGTDFYKFIEDHPYGTNYNIRKDIKLTMEMKYNRMVLYEARHTHGATLNRSMFKEHPRLAQVFFM
tara:strand:+ start:619 stop:1281 length:663 start_codon:yes stop_codon:yes gene_type:complete